MKRSRVTLLAGFAAALLALSACGGGNTILTVNGQAVTRDQLDNKLENSTSPVTARGMLQLMVTDDLIDQYAQTHHINVSPAEINKMEGQYKGQYPQAEWDQMLKTRGLTEQDVQDLIRRQLILDKALSNKVTVSNNQIAQYFAINHAALDQPAQAKAKHILVADSATAQKVEADLKAGKDFAAEAKQYSIDPGSKGIGGELGWFPRGRMVAPFEQYAFSGPIGKVSPPIKSPLGYHIIVVEGRKPAVKATLANSRARITQMLHQQQETPLIQQFLQGLQQSAKIDVQDQRFADLFPSPPPVAPVPPPAPSSTQK
ncbi:MAG TPA: peptidylprolyl isomerase [Candidatus Rubrimentiphilum sp.]|nr:peptidylprolyl isomerase [Candidatus Rubrimentiphilum sp.]